MALLVSLSISHEPPPAVHIGNTNLICSWAAKAVTGRDALGIVYLVVFSISSLRFLLTSQSIDYFQGYTLMLAF